MINKLNYKELKVYLDLLNTDESHFSNSNDICTPMGCVEEMVNKLPKSFWKKNNLKILDPCCGNGNFHGYISQKTNLKNLYFNDINEKRLKNVKKIFGNNVNVSSKDFLDFENKEQFDLVVANPPYAKFTDGKRTAKNHNIFKEFIVKALNITKKNGYVLFIVPDSWMSFADSNKTIKILRNYQFIYLNIHGAKKWFPKVGSSFTWFLLQKKDNQKSFVVDNNYKLKNKENCIIDKTINYIPLYYSEIVRSILNKTIYSGYPKYIIETTSYLHKFTKKNLISSKKSSKFKYRLIHTPSQTVYSSIPHKFQNGFKVFISLTNQYDTFVDNCGMTQSIAFIRCKSVAEANLISKTLKKEIYVFLNNISRFGNFNNIRVLQRFPLYKYIKLNKKEKEFVIKFNQAYYSKK